jgi:hypothetical protein
MHVVCVVGVDLCVVGFVHVVQGVGAGKNGDSISMLLLKLS